MAEDRAVAVRDPEDAHEVAAALLRLADEADQRGKVSFLDEERRRELADELARLAEALNPSKQAVAPQLWVLWVSCPRCARQFPLQFPGPMRCQCGAAWEFRLVLSSG